MHRYVSNPNSINQNSTSIPDSPSVDRRKSKSNSVSHDIHLTKENTTYNKATTQGATF